MYIKEGIEMFTPSERPMPATIYSRVVGYYAPVNITWNKGKRQEFKERKAYSVEKALGNETPGIAGRGETA